MSGSASVQVSVTINAEPATVWRFLSEADKVLAWMTYLPGAPIPEGSAFEPRPGGEISIIFPNGGRARGKVLELTPPKRLVFTWGYDPDVAATGLGPGACRVEITLAPSPQGTRVTLTHSGPMTDELARGHEAGWRHNLSQLALHSAHAATEAALQQTLPAYWQAWNQRDDQTRLALLRDCCEPDVRVRSAFACTDTVEELTAHIANGLRHMPGAMLGPDGPPRHVHGVARASWSVTGGNGQVMFRGENILRLSPRGRIAEVIGFQC